jgi:putative transposase
MAGVQAAPLKRSEIMAKSLSHTKWMCKYHIVFTPKYRRKIIYNQYKASIVEILKDLCKWKGVEIIEGNARIDHVAIPLFHGVQVCLKNNIS